MRLDGEGGMGIGERAEFFKQLVCGGDSKTGGEYRVNVALAVCKVPG
jgi:hypothetical protein